MSGVRRTLGMGIPPCFCCNTTINDLRAPIDTQKVLSVSRRYAKRVKCLLNIIQD